MINLNLTENDLEAAVKNLSLASQLAYYEGFACFLEKKAKEKIEVKKEVKHE